jgi:hypothetical protein
VVDRARLESVCTLKGTEGSNPSFSASCVAMETNLTLPVQEAFFFEILGFFIAVFLAKIQILFLQKRQKSSISNELAGLFKKTWNGLEEDRLYAWQRVRLYVVTFGADPAKLAFVDKKIRSLKRKPFLSATFVDVNGDLLIK